MRCQPAQRFWFRLALSLGMSVRRTQAEISSEEFSKWIAYSILEPFGEKMADFRSGILASVIANAHRGRGTVAFKPTDFVPEFDREAVRTTPDQVKASLRAMAVFCGGRIVDERDK